VGPWLVILGIVAVGALVGLITFRPARNRRQGRAVDGAADYTVGDQIRQDRSESRSPDYSGDSGGGGGGGD